MEILTVTNPNLTQFSFDYWDFIIKLAMAIAVWLVFRAFYKIQDKIKEQQVFIRIQNLIMSYRNYNSFLSRYDGIDYYRVPNETPEQFFERIPEGQFKLYLIKEYDDIRAEIIHKLDINRSEAEKYLAELYFWEEK